MVGLSGALEVLRKRGIERLLVEGGSRVLTSFFRAGLVDRVEIECVATILGSGTPLVGALIAPVRLVDVTTERLGASVLVRGTVAR
jgi:riboflavin biosynthesis pyrimidine reductase